MSIHEKALLVELNISTWTANKLDRTKTDQILHESNAGTRAGTFVKNLMTGTSLVKDTSDYAALCRTWNTKQTLPWQDRGPRFAPTSMFIDYKRDVDNREQTFWSMVDGVVDGYEEAKEVARVALGSLWNPNDYPDASQIRAKYAWSFNVTPVPKSGHFMVDVPAKELAEMQASCDAGVDVKLKEAMQSAWDRLHSMCLDMSNKLTEGEEGKKKRWHNSFVDNPIELCDLLSHMNITNDPKLEQLRRQLEVTMSGANIEVLKDSLETRQALKRDVDSILKQCEW